MVDCPLCKNFIDQTNREYTAWVKTATDEEYKKSDAKPIEFHCPLCNSDIKMVVMVRK